MRIEKNRTLIDKLWEAHEITLREDGTSLIWIDRHLLHEGSYLSFDLVAGLGARIAHPELTFGVADHYVPTRRRSAGVTNPDVAHMPRQLEDNTRKAGVRLIGLDDPRQGIVHVVAPEQGLTLPGLTLVCGDSHTSTHGAFGTYAFGIGASEVAHVLMTQTLWQKRPKRRVRRRPLPTPTYLPTMTADYARPSVSMTLEKSSSGIVGTPKL